MKHPFDDFLPPSYHSSKEDKRILRAGMLLVATVFVATALAFANSWYSWKELANNREGVAVRWNDAETRVLAYVKAQKTMKDAVKQAVELERYVESAPRSLIVWEVTQSLPAESILADVRLETRKRKLEDETEETTELLTLIGFATDDASISSYMDSLSSCGLFTNVSLLYAQQEGETSKRNFSIQLFVQPAKQIALETSQ